MGNGYAITISESPRCQAYSQPAEQLMMSRMKKKLQSTNWNRSDEVEIMKSSTKEEVEGKMLYLDVISKES